MTAVERQPQALQDAAQPGEWLALDHKTYRELWVQIFKTGSGRRLLTWSDRLIEAIRFGWIDGQSQSLDEASYLQRLIPRKPTSNCSAKNLGHATALTAAGRLTPVGLEHVEAATADSRREGAYAGSATMAIPRYVLDALQTMSAVKAFFATLDRKIPYAICYRLQTAKHPETRAKRLTQILVQLHRGERFH